MKKVLLVIFLVALQGVISYFLLKYLFERDHPAEVKIVEKSANEEYEVMNYEFGEIIVNPSDSKGRRFFIANIVLLYSDEMEAFPEEVDKMKPSLTDTMMSIIMMRNIEELTSRTGKESLRVELEVVVETMMQQEIHKLLFKKYLIQ